MGKVGFSDLITRAPLAAPLIAGAKAAIQFESAMADLHKVVNFDNPTQFAQMGDDIGKLSEKLPMTANDIAKLVAAGGQAGIARGELLGFAEDAVKVGIAFGQTAEQSGDMMARWRTSFKMTQADVVGLADRINYLGSTGGANTRQISDVVTRVGPLGKAAGPATGQIAAMGATMVGAGVEQDVAATGIKNFMLAMTQGSAATKSQAQAFKALRLDAEQVAHAMQTDAQGTILDLLNRVGGVEGAKQAGVLGSLFGTESVTAVASLLANLELLKRNLNNVGDASQYAGSVDREYASRAGTTEHNLTLLRNSVASVVRAMGTALLPGINEVVNSLQPWISHVAELTQANPALVRGITAASIAFTAMRVAVVAATVAAQVMGVAFAATPIGLIAVGMAAAAGLIIANWDKVGPFFEAFWELIKAYSVPVWDLLKQMFAWSPLGMIVRNWEPIVGFIQGLLDKVKPILKAIGIDAGEGGTLAERVQAMADARNLRNAGPLSGDGSMVRAGAPGAALQRQQQLNLATGVPATSELLNRPNLPAPGSLLISGAGKAQLDGALVVRFENAPPGLRPQPAQTNQPGLKVTTNVGYRTLSGAP
nr:phage tail tape measure protein [Pseudomonas sp. RIT-PI-S]